MFDTSSWPSQLLTPAFVVCVRRGFRFQPTDERCNMDLDDVDPTHWAAVQVRAKARRQACCCQSQYALWACHPEPANCQHLAGDAPDGLPRMACCMTVLPLSP